MTKPVDNFFGNTHKIVLSQIQKVNEVEVSATTLKTELCNRLRKFWVMCSVDVECSAPGGSLILDVAVHTHSFIFGSFCIEPGKSGAMPKRNGIESRYCGSLNDINECVAWAVDLQERYMHCHSVRAVA